MAKSSVYYRLQIDCGEPVTRRGRLTCGLTDLSCPRQKRECQETCHVAAICSYPIQDLFISHQWVNINVSEAGVRRWVGLHLELVFCANFIAHVKWRSQDYMASKNVPSSCETRDFFRMYLLFFRSRSSTMKMILVSHM